MGLSYLLPLLVLVTHLTPPCVLQCLPNAAFSTQSAVAKKKKKARYDDSSSPILAGVLFYVGSYREMSLSPPAHLVHTLAHEY